MSDAIVPFMNRQRTLHIAPTLDGGYAFTATLLDSAREAQSADAVVTVHEFVVEGELKGSELVLASLTARAHTTPFASCPFVLPLADGLVGLSLLSGWRSSVLKLLGGTRGCTHMNTLLLSLSELAAMVFFLRINEEVPYTQEARDDGTWNARSLLVAPRVVGACHSLREDGPVLGPLLRAEPSP